MKIYYDCELIEALRGDGYEIERAEVGAGEPR